MRLGLLLADEVHPRRQLGSFDQRGIIIQQLLTSFVIHGMMGTEYLVSNELDWFITNRSLSCGWVCGMGEVMG